MHSYLNISIMKKLLLLQEVKKIVLLSTLLVSVIVNGQGDHVGGGKSTKDKKDNTAALAIAKNSTKARQSEKVVTPVLPQAAEIVKGQRSRVKDGYGSGQYGSSRDGGTRTHDGIDIIVTAGEDISSPIKGTIVREAVPYGSDPNYKGVVIKGTDEWVGYEIKIFYAEGLFSGKANLSQKIGVAQSISAKYPGITDHIHLEVRVAGVLVDPFTIWQYSF